MDKDAIIITHVVSHCSLYVQPLSKQQDLAKLHKELNDTMAIAPPMAKYPGSGDLVAAPFEGDYYRGRVISVDVSNDTVKIGYIDYGNSEEVQFAQLKVLPERFLEHPRFSMRVSLAGIDADIDPDESKNVKNEITKCMENTYTLNGDQKNIEMNAPVTLINKFDETSLNELMLDKISCRFKVDDLEPKIVNGTDVKLIIYDTSKIESGLLTCFLSSEKKAVVELEKSIQGFGKKIQMAPAYIPKPHELCLIKEMDDGSPFWYRAVFEQELIDNMAEIIKLDFMTKARVNMNNIRAFDKSITRELYTFTCKIKGSGKYTIDELKGGFKNFAEIEVQTVQYLELRGAHIIAIDAL